ncbi:MAG: YicC family protein [Oceanospirillaceae bacterium]|nr:YicC family protein [Oceanospirillaceae bacterium]
MTRSMTAFARQESQHSWGNLVWELRSVNQRFLEPHIRIPDSFREIEPLMREQLRKHLSRGKIDCTLRFEVSKAQQSMQVNEKLAQQLIKAAEKIGSLTSSALPIDTLEVLRWPGVMLDAELDMEACKKHAVNLFAAAIQDLNQGRAREGEQLALLIATRLDSITQVVADVRDKMPLILDKQRELLLKRVADLGLEIDGVRIEQEIALLAQKADVAEEIDRLDTHVQEVRRILQQKGAIGRRLDFLMQELNREANTLSSKSIVVDTTNSAVELKVLIEQMREQIQNIE